MPTVQQNRFHLVDGLRGLAAVWVFLFHLSEGGHIPLLLDALPEWVQFAVFDAGHLGVPVFFVLSGYVMALTVSTVAMDLPNAGRFVIKRLIRLAPPYYVAVLIGAAVALVKGGQEGTFETVFWHLTFAQSIAGVPQLNPVFWTLGIEVQFYICFALLCWVAQRLNRQESTASLGRWVVFFVAGLFALAWPSGMISSSLWSGGFIGFWYSFVCGVLSGLAIEGGRLRTIVAVVFCATVLLIGIEASNSFAATAGATAVCLVGIRSVGTLPVPRWLSALGLISYSIYLFHNPVTGVLMRGARQLSVSGVWFELFASAFVLVACIAFSSVAYVLVERPAIALSRRVSGKVTPQT